MNATLFYLLVSMMLAAGGIFSVYFVGKGYYNLIGGVFLFLLFACIFLTGSVLDAGLGLESASKFVSVLIAAYGAIAWVMHKEGVKDQKSVSIAPDK